MMTLKQSLDLAQGYRKKPYIMMTLILDFAGENNPNIPPKIEAKLLF